MKKLSLVLLFLIIGFITHAQKKYTVDEIPDPKRQGQEYFVSDPDGVLSDVDSLNKLIIKLEKETKIEVAVVIVKDFEENLDEFEFGINLFRKWSIGKKGYEHFLKNNYKVNGEFRDIFQHLHLYHHLFLWFHRLQ